MKTIVIKYKGQDEADFEAALQIIVKQVLDGYREGFDGNEVGSYSYTVTEEAAPERFKGKIVVE